MKHINLCKHICHYLAGTQIYSLVYKSDGNGIDTWTDSDWGNDETYPDPRHSIQGMIVLLTNGATTWVSHCQKTIALSSVEAEYMALSDACRHAKWLTSFFGELSFDVSPISVTGDNQGSIFIGQNPVTERRSKHIDI